MTRDHTAFRLVAVIIIFALAATFGWLWMRDGFSDSRWLSQEIVQQSSDAAAAGAAPVGAAPGDDAFADGPSPEAPVDVAAAPAAAADPLRLTQEGALERLTRALASAAGVGVLIAAGWLFATNARAPAAAGPQGARSMGAPWFIFLLIYLLSLAAIFWVALADAPVAGKVSANGRWLSAGVSGVLLALGFWLSTIFATARTLRPSVPGGRLLP